MIKTTTDYSQFSLMEQNRDIDMSNRKVKNLADSMQKYGWLDAFPMMVARKRGKLVVIDGQHRLAVAQENGIPAKYVIDDQDVDVAHLNDTSHSWKVEDFVHRFAKEGKSDYIELVEFSERYGIPMTMASGILANTANYSNVTQRVKNGNYKITNRPMAMAVAECYKSLCEVSPVFRKVNPLKVLFACFQVSYFDPDRLVSGAEKKASEMKSITKLELFYELFEEIYNYKRKDKHPLKFDAEQAMKARNIKNR